jgi:hypothetical protein
MCLKNMNTMAPQPILVNDIPPIFMQVIDKRDRRPSTLSELQQILVNTLGQPMHALSIIGRQESVNVRGEAHLKDIKLLTYLLGALYWGWSRCMPGEYALSNGALEKILCF